MSIQDKKKEETIERVATLFRKRFPAPGLERAERFAHQYHTGVASEDLLERPPEDLYGAVVSHWNLAQQRRPKTPLIRVYNPTYGEHGWQSTHTVIEIVTDNMPFLVDSVSMELVRHGLTVHLIIHPVIRVIRDNEGRLQEVLPQEARSEDAIAEAVIRFEVDRQAESGVRAALRTDLERVLTDVRATVEDWPRMRNRIKEIVATLEAQTLPVPKDELAEDLQFLRWIEDHHFTFVGFRAYDLNEESGQDVLRLVPGSGLGIFRDSSETHLSQSFSHIPPQLRTLARAPTLLILTKSTARSTVHRAAHLDYVGIKRFDDTGNVIGEWRFLGLYSSSAYSARPAEMPLLRKKTAYVLQRAGLDASSHSGKKLHYILDTFPRDELFQATKEALYEIATGILQLQERHKLKLFLRKDLFGRFVTALVFIPRDHYSTELRLRIQDILMQVLNGQGSEFTVQFSESVLARVYFIVRTQPEGTPEYDVADLETRFAEAMLSWEDELQAALHDQLGEAQGNQRGHRYGEAFPAAYRDDFSARTAVLDILSLEAISDAEPLSTHLYRPLEGPDELLRFKVFGRHRPMALSDVLPMLERMGLRVLGARPYEIEPKSSGPFWILDFDMTVAHGIEVEVLEVKDIFQEAFAKVFSGEMENDGFNRLVLAADLGWRSVVMLRAICKYLLQTRLPFSQTYMEQSLAGNPGIAKLLVQLFHTRLDPARPDNAAELTERWVGRIEQALDAVVSLDEDRILRHFLALIQAMLRSNYFQQEADGKPKTTLAFKLNSTQVPDLPLPLPMFEIFVYSPWIEGIHLRGGPVARGGIRWSGRREDFRTEILGLMKAQMVKNAVIVPVGAKGGFVVKRPPSADKREHVQEEVVRCYRAFISALLDLTDNLVDGTVTPPREVVRYDSDDPYLVVAADKGTASFSDIANSVAAEYRFWLGDAFASGGSTGYDHKKMGITARGAWESVKRHFRELDIDIQSTPLSGVGIGDMSGDVFGNGLLLSKHLRLIAAFNHVHLFIDPDPDPAVSYQERARLFQQPRSSWTDYDPQLISEGGGVFRRSAKSISLSPQAREALAVETERLTPNELIQAILRAPVDLLWNGGIGTYVKAGTESHADVGDRANDAVRVDACELRCRVVSEGGNLGLTQLGRIEFAKGGGLINTDAIDNSGGVDCSDHEVNIKILLDQVVRNGDMTLKQRNQLLTKMTDEVAELVLRHNYLQTQALSIADGQSAHLLTDHARVILALEREGGLRRRLEFLPSDEELAKRELAHAGLTRPEIAVLLAYSKIELYRALQTSDIAEDAYLSQELQSYFPRPLQERFVQQMEAHPLRRAIIATHVTNSMINRMGSTFCICMQEDTGQTAADIARAYTAAREIFRARALWSATEALDNQVAAGIQLDMLSETRRLLDRGTLWLLRNRHPPLDIAATVAQFTASVEIIAEHLPQLLKGEFQEALQHRTHELNSAGISPALAQTVAGLDPLYSALDIAEVARATESEIIQVADAYFALGLTLELHWLRDRIRELPRLNRWQRKARAALRDELYAELRALTGEFLRVTADIEGTEPRIEAWLTRNKLCVEHCHSLIADLKASSQQDLAMLSVAVREIRNLAPSGMPHTA